MNIGFAIKTPPAEKLPGDLAREVLARVSAPFVYQSEAVNLANAVITLEERVQGLLDANNAEVESRRGIGHILGRLRLAVYGLYFAARWSPDRFCEESQLWSELRDAAGITPGAGTSALGPKKPVEETGWLIESKDPSGMGGPLYLGLHDKICGWGFSWETDSAKGLRFSRKVDAEIFVKNYTRRELGEYSVVEHTWSSADAAADSNGCSVAAQADTGEKAAPVLRQRITTTWVLHADDPSAKAYVVIRGNITTGMRVTSTARIDEVMHFATKADAQKLIDVFGGSEVLSVRPVEAVWMDGEWIGSRL